MYCGFQHKGVLASFISFSQNRIIVVTNSVQIFSWLNSLNCLFISWNQMIFLWKGSVKNLYSSFLESLFCKKSFMEAWNIMNKYICGTVSFSANGNTTLLKLISLFIIMIVKLPLLILFTFWSVNLTFRNLV